MTESKDTEKELTFESAIQLDALLARIVDSREGYRLAADHVDNHLELRGLFERIAEQRDRFCLELQAAAERNGIPLRQEMSLGHTLKAVYRSLKDLFTEHPPASVLEECIEFEQNALEIYNRQIRVPTIPKDIRDILSRQRSRIEAEIAELQRLETQLS